VSPSTVVLDFTIDFPLGFALVTEEPLLEPPLSV
jgi:hypothetical protein